jgi:hypothetical protein
MRALRTLPVSRSCLEPRHRFEVRILALGVILQKIVFSAVRLKAKLVAHTVYCEKVPRVRRVALQFLWKPQHVVVYSPRAGVVLVPPSFIEKFIPRNHAMGVPCQELQCLKFLWSNADFLAATSNLGFEKSTVTSAKTYTSAPSGLKRDTRLIDARRRATSFVGAHFQNHARKIPDAVDRESLRWVVPGGVSPNHKRHQGTTSTTYPSKEKAAAESSATGHWSRSQFGCWTVQGVGLFKVAAKVVAAISFFPSAGLPIDSHLRYHRVDSSESPCPFVKPTNKSRSLCLARNKLVFDWCRHRSCLLGSHWGIPPKVAGVRQNAPRRVKYPTRSDKSAHEIAIRV